MYITTLNRSHRQYGGIKNVLSIDDTKNGSKCMFESFRTKISKFKLILFQENK